MISSGWIFMKSLHNKEIVRMGCFIKIIGKLLWKLYFDNISLNYV